MYVSCITRGSARVFFFTYLLPHIFSFVRCILGLIVCFWGIFCYHNSEHWTNNNLSSSNLSTSTRCKCYCAHTFCRFSNKINRAQPQGRKNNHLLQQIIWICRFTLAPPTFSVRTGVHNQVQQRTQAMNLELAQIELGTLLPRGINTRKGTLWEHLLVASLKKNSYASTRSIYSYTR